MGSFKTAVSSFFNGILKLLRMENSQEHYKEVTLLEQSLDINTYYHCLDTEYQFRGTERMQALVVEEITLCKKLASPEHEYIVARVKPRHGAKARDPFYVIFERFRGAKVPKNTEPTDRKSDSSTATSPPTLTSPPILPRPVTQPAPEETSPSQFSSVSGFFNAVSDKAASVPDMASNGSIAVCNGSSASLVSSSRKISGGRFADDRVTLGNNAHCGRYSGKDTVYRTLTFSDNSPLYFYELVILAQAIHRAEDQYLLVGAQCYYYAGSIVQVLQDVCNVSEATVATTGSLEEDKVQKIRKEPSLPKRGDGKYKTIPIYSGLRSSKVDKLITMYHQAKVALETAVHDVEQANLKKDEIILQQGEALHKRDETIHDLSNKVDNQALRIKELESQLAQ